MGKSIYLQAKVSNARYRLLAAVKNKEVVQEKEEKAEKEEKEEKVQEKE